MEFPKGSVFKYDNGATQFIAEVVEYSSDFSEIKYKILDKGNSGWENRQITSWIDFDHISEYITRL